MRFALVKISGSRLGDQIYTYRSTVMEMGGSDKCTNTFEGEREMIETMNGILAKRKRLGDVRRVLDQIKEGGFYFFDLDLTREEAESLGWKLSPFGQAN